MKKKQKRLSVVFVLLSALMLTIPASAAQTEQQVFDEAELLTSSEMETLTETLEELERLSGWDVMAVTVDDPSVSSARDYAEETFLARAHSEDGIIYLLDMNSRELYMATSGEAIYYMTDERIDDAVAEGISYAGDEAYGQALNAMAQVTTDCYRQGIPENQRTYQEEDGTYTYYHESEQNALSSGEVAVAVMAAAAACAIFCGVIVGKYRLKFGRYRYDFHSNSSLKLQRKEDLLVNRFITTRRIPKNPPSSSGGGTSTVHRGSGGGNFGGGGGKF